MKKLLSLYLLCALVITGNLINGVHEEAETVAAKAPLTTKEINDHNASMVEKMDSIQPMKLTTTSDTSLYPVTAEPSKNTANFVDTINGKGGISFGKNQAIKVSSDSGSNAKITTDNDGKIVKTVITHPTTSTGMFGLSKTTAQTTIEHHEDGTHTITKTSTLNTGLFGPKHTYTETTRVNTTTNEPLSSNINVRSTSALWKTNKEINLNLNSGDIITKNADGSYKKEATEPNSRQATNSNFDKNDKLQNETVLDKDGKEISHTTRIVNHQDRSVTRYIDNADGTKTTRLTNKDGQTVTEETTDPKNNNRLVKRITVVGEGDKQVTNIFEMNHATNETTYTTMNHDGSSKSRTTNAKNITIKSIIIDKNQHKTETENDDDGELKQETITDKDGNKIKEVAVNKDTDPVTTTTTEYNPITGKPASIEIIHEGNEATRQEPYTTTQVFEGLGKSVTTTTDSHGDITTVSTTEVDPLNAKSITTVNDTTGNLIKTVTVTNKGTDQETHTTVHYSQWKGENHQDSTITEMFNAKGIKTKSVVNGKHTTTTTDYDTSGKFKKEVVVDKKGDILTETEIDPTTGKRITTRHEVKDDIRTTKSQDARGNQVETIINYTTGHKTVVERDASQGEIVTTEYSDKDSDEHQHVLVTSILDDSKKLYEETTVNGIKTTDKYSSPGVKQSTTVEDTQNNVVQSHTEFHENGKVKIHTEFNENGKMKEEAECDENGDITQHTIFDNNEKVKSREIFEKDGSSKTYDGKGNLISSPIDSTPSSPRSTATNF